MTVTFILRITKQVVLLPASWFPSFQDGTKPGHVPVSSCVKLELCNNAYGVTFSPTLPSIYPVHLSPTYFKKNSKMVPQICPHPLPVPACETVQSPRVGRTWSLVFWQKHLWKELFWQFPEWDWPRILSKRHGKMGSL